MNYERNTLKPYDVVCFDAAYRERAATRAALAKQWIKSHEVAPLLGARNKGKVRTGPPPPISGTSPATGQSGASAAAKASKQDKHSTETGGEKPAFVAVDYLTEDMYMSREVWAATLHALVGRMY